MEPGLGNGLNGIAAIVIEKWFAAMGLVGLLLFATALIVEMPTDRTVVICISLIMMGWGFGQAECRTFRQHIGNGYKLTGPAWRLTVSGALLFALAFGAAVKLALHVI